MKNKTLMALLFLAFFGGFGFGHFSERVFFHHPFPPKMDKHGRGMATVMLKKLDHRLHLSSAQKENILPLLREADLGMREMFNKAKPEMIENRHRLNERIRPFLSPKQQQKFDQFNQKMDERFLREDGPPGPEPDM